MDLLLEALVSLLIVLGGVFAPVGSWGLARLPSLMTRLHGPTKATTLGVTLSPSAFSSTTGLPPSRTAITLLVVPRSMPTALAIAASPLSENTPTQTKLSRELSKVLS